MCVLGCACVLVSLSLCLIVVRFYWESPIGTSGTVYDFGNPLIIIIINVE